jgi:predicted ATPase
LSHPLTQSLAESFVGVMRQFRRDLDPVKRHAERTIEVWAEYRLTNFYDYATILLGWATAQRGHSDEGLARMREGVAALRATGAEFRIPYFLSLLAEVYLQTDRIEQGLSALQEALTAAIRSEDRNHEAELYRLKGELLLRRDSSHTPEAQTCFARAIEIARKQSARSLELRATMSLARLLAKQDNRDEARAMLADIYGWFTEGFDTADLIEAKALLEELS